ncbi:MAG: histidinol-phosphatase HisJ family protein [Candidatus Berkelbacteria bacterium]|nr:histidinol-phosphatase HisJ family protein [Candidatus Berkelbacteria bacterium]
MTDSHLHTNYSHGKSTLDEMIQASIDFGLDNIGFAEHFIYDYFTENALPTVQGRSVDGTPLLKFKEYCAEVIKAKNKYKDTIKIRLGAEVDFIKGKEDEIAREIKSQNTNFDFMLGSVHFLGNPIKYFTDYINEPWVKQEYFSSMERCINSMLFDVLAHPMLIQYYMDINEKEYKSISEEVTDLLRQKGMALELNTDYFSSGRILNPGAIMLKMCKKKKIPIVIGSDAHSAAKIAKNYKETFGVLDEIGIKELCYFEKREPVFYSIN